MDMAAWVWDADRRRIVAANGHAVSFWQELSVLDLIDTLFGEYHPMSLQFAKAQKLISNPADAVDMSIDFNSMGINETVNCQFSPLQSDDERNVVLIKIVKAIIVETTDELPSTTPLQDDDVIAKMLDNAPVALALFDKNGEFCFANEHCQQIFSKNQQEFIAPHSLADWFVQNDDSDADAESLIEKCLAYNIANMSSKLNTAFGPRSHSIIAKSLAVKPLDEGQQYVLIYLRDVADERHYEQILIERIAKLEQLTQLGSDFYFILDDELNFVQLGGNFEKLTGYAASELLGESWQTIADTFALDPDGVASAYFAERKSFDNLSIDWPVKDSETDLSLTWRGRSIYEQQNGENIFIGSFVTAFENILAISDDELAEHVKIDSVSDDVELIEDEADDDISDGDIAEDDISDEDISDDEIADIDGYDSQEDVTDLAALDGVAADLDIDDEADEDAEEISMLNAPLKRVEEDEAEEKTSDIELTTLETNLSDVEAVNFASLAQTLNGTLDEVIAQNGGETSTDDVEEVIARSDNVIAEINEILGNDGSDQQEVKELADNVVPVFGATADGIARFGRSEVDMFKLVLDQTPIMAVITSLPSDDGIYTLFANKEVLHNLGLIQDKNQEMGNDEYADILSVESMEFLNSLKDEFNQVPIDQEVSFLVNGEKHYFNAKINKIDWQDNKALQYILSPKINLDSLDSADELTDANDQTVDEASEIEPSDNILQFVLDAQAFIDNEQNILSSNVYLNNILGMTSNDLIGKPLNKIIAENGQSAFRNYMNTILQDEEKNLSLDGVELDLVNKIGENHTVYLHIERLNAEEAQNFPSDILVNMRDISLWKKKEANLLEAKDRAEHENTQKSGFLARISHELRTPLNAIIGFSEVMSDEKFGPLENSRYKGYAQDINESGAHLLSLINDLLDLSKVEAGKVELNFKALDLEPLIIQAVSLMQPMADKKRIIIRTSISSTLPQIVADMRSIRQIVLNLLSNSIKYSNPGSQVIMSALMDDDGEVIIRVRDTGIGMAEDQLEAAMEPFKTLNMSTLVDRQGTGLGLPLTKALAEANRADFSIESAVDAGTLVQITFPTTRVLTS